MTTKQKHCFIVGPIGAENSEIRNHSDWLLDGIILPVFHSDFTDFTVERADKMATPGMIDAQIIRCLLDSDLVIADMTYLNPNVFYEIGIRHAIGMPIIHMFLEGTDIPFDVKLHRAIAFDTRRFMDIENGKKKLYATLSEVLDPSYIVENPVSNVRGGQVFSEHATSEQELISDRLQELEKKFDTFQETAGRSARHAKGETPSPHSEIISVDSSIGTPFLISIDLQKDLDDSILISRKNTIEEISKRYAVHLYTGDVKSALNNVSLFGNDGTSFSAVKSFAEEVAKSVQNIEAIRLA